MAKLSQRPEAISRIRFIMLDAEIPSGEIEQVTLAIQNALRPVAPQQQRIVGQIAAPMVLREPSNGEQTVAEVEPQDFSEDFPAEPKASSTRRQAENAKPRNYRTPVVLEVNLTDEMSWERYASDKQPTTDTDRFLVAAAWFKECRREDSITVDHIYTCYRAVKWPTAIDDFAAPLRKLKQQQFMTSPERNHYAINHLGIARVEKLGSS